LGHDEDENDNLYKIERERREAEASKQSGSKNNKENATNKFEPRKIRQLRTNKETL
jgi:hypothetical protein